MWHRTPLVAFDLETTGVSPSNDRIVTAAVLHIRPSEGLVERHEWLLNPGVDIPEAATAVHGVTTANAVEHGRDPAGALLEIAAHIGNAADSGTPLVVYNAPYDLTMLTAECIRHGHPQPGIGPVVDPLVLDRALDRYRRGSRRLTAVAAHYGIVLPETEAHGASADALAAARVAWRLANAFPHVTDIDAAELHTHQAGWHAIWAEQFEQWLAEHPHRENETIPRDWPVRTVTG